MMEFITFIQSKKGWKDSNGNVVSFSDKDLQGNETGGCWIYLDEGFRCGGMCRNVAEKKEVIQNAILGFGKTELWEMIENEWKEGQNNVCGKTDRTTNS